MHNITYEDVYRILAKHLGCKPHEIAIVSPLPYTQVFFDNFNNKYATGKELVLFLTEQLGQIDDNVLATMKIPLIKRFRKICNCTLGYAKNAIEDWTNYLTCCEQLNCLPHTFGGYAAVFE